MLTLFFTTFTLTQQEIALQSIASEYYQLIVGRRKTH